MALSQPNQHWIKSNAITIDLNFFGDPDFLQVSVNAGTVIMAYQAGIIDYNAAHNFRQWPLVAYNTKLAYHGPVKVYARMTRDEVNASAMLIYSENSYTLDGRVETINEEGIPEYTDSDLDYYYAYLGEISSKYTESGEIQDRFWSVPFRSGTLNTDQFFHEYVGGEWEVMFRYNSVMDMIEVLKPMRSVIMQDLSLNDFFSFKGKKVEGISRGIDDPFENPSPYKLATTDYVSAFVDERYLRKDIDDTAHGNITFDLSIHSKDYIEGFDTGKGWMISKDGDADFNSVNVRSNLVVGNRSGSPVFISGFPNGIGWDLSPYERINAADVAEKKWRLEIDDINVRGKMRVYEFVISQLRGENDNVIFAGMMRVDHADPENNIIYLDTEKGVLYNPFRSGDILMVQRFGGMPSAENQYNVIKQYELRVKEAYIGNLSDGEERVDWIEVEKFAGDWADVAERDVLTRVDSLTDSTRKGIVKVTTVDEIGAPYIDVVYGMKTNPETATKVRMGNLSGVRTRNNRDLTGVWGLYAEGAVLENSTYYMQDGNTIEQNFTILNGKLESEISTVKSDMSLEAGNILRNSSFGSNMNYWSSEDEVHFIWTSDGYIFASDAFYVEKNKVADIVADNGRYVLRLRNNSIKQLNSLMSLDGVDFGSEEDEQKPNFSFAFYYKPLTAGTLKVGFDGKELFAEESLSPAGNYAQYSKYATWDGTGDFSISYTGEILIYAVSLFNDKLADAKIYLEGKITQTAEALTSDYKKLIVDSEDNILQEMSTQFKQTAESISAQATRIDNINKTIANAGWITTADGNKLWANKYMDDGTLLTSAITQNAREISLKVSEEDFTGETVVSKINLLKGTAKIEAENINLIGKVTFSMLSQDAINGVQPDLSPYVKTATIIEGGYIKTGLINTDVLFANLVKVGQFSIQSGGQLSWVGLDYFGKNEFQMKLGSSKTPTSTGFPSIIHTFSSSGGSHAGIAAILSASTNSVAIYGSTDGWGSNWPNAGPFAGYFSGKVKVTGECQAGTLAANAFRYAYNQAASGSYTYYAGINVDPGDYDLDNIRFRIRGGIIVGVTDDNGNVLRGV